jgi:Cu/Ag efflux protein CusF
MRTISFLILTFALFAGGSSAQESKQGQIVGLNASTGMITVKLGDGNTESYLVKDALLFNALNVGDAIRFVAQQENGKLAIRNVEKQ